MECTQRLECTQDLYDSPIEKTCPEQIGFLGICGSKYPVKKGPNKIGRDPQTCSIVLQLESISRQHAVINILNKAEFMLMDLDSANKTKLSGKTLQPYIPHPLQHGDTVQFGKVFGIFRLLQEDPELPATQALDIPDTPVAGRPTSRLHAVTTVPESPEVSDRDDSFIAPSQPKLHNRFKNETNNFIKPAAKTISIQPIGSKKIDNVYWNTSKKSTSIGSTLDESNQSINDSTISVNKSNNTDLHEMETQPPTGDVHNVSVDSIYTADTQMPNVCNQKTIRQSVDSIYTADTQMPNHNGNVDTIHSASTQLPSVSSRNVSVDSIYTANTQAPENFNCSPSIHSLDTQMPATDNLPNVCKVNNQQEMQFDFCLANKENDISIFNAETQPLLQNIPKKSEPINKAVKICKAQNDTSKSSVHTSEEEILFDDIDNESFQDEFESQSLLPESPKKQNINNKADPVITVNKPAKRDARLKSDSSTDSEDIEIAATQQLPMRPAEDDLTDCEDDLNDNHTKTEQPPKQDDQIIVFEEMLTQVLDDELSKYNRTIANPKTNTLPVATTSKIPIEHMLTQVIEEDQPTNILPTIYINFEDMPTQIISDEKGSPEKNNFDEQQTQILYDDIPDKVNELKKISNDFVSPFKVPLQSPRKAKRKDTSKFNKVIETNTTENNPKIKNFASENDDKYYEATQDILDDLCTQQLSPEVLPVKHDDDDVVPCSVEDDKTGDYKLPGLDYDVSPKSSDKSSESNLDEKLNQFVTNLSREQIQEVIGVHPLKRQTSDPSDTEATPKKVHPVKFFETDLPDSQEIKTSVSLHYNSNVTESSSESETENDTEEQFSPILYRKKKKPKVDTRLDVTKKLNVDSLPSRVITRVRKPPLKHGEDSVHRRKPQYLTEQEGDISNEIVIENITRLKNKNEKNKSTEVSKKIENESKTAQPLIKTEDNSKGKYKSDSIKGHASKTKHNTKDKQNSDDIKEQLSKSNITNDRRKTDDIKKHVSKSEHITEDKRKNDNDKEQTNKSERSKRDKPNHAKGDNSSISKLSKSKTQSGLLNIDVTSGRSKRSTRRTRNKSKVTDKDTEKRSASLEKGKDKKEKKDDDKRKKSSKKEEDKQETDVQELRRSRRQRSYKEKKENDSLIKVKITKPAKKEVKQIQVHHENSTVYSVSSDSGADTPKRLKRSATEVLRAPSPKRTRSAASAAQADSDPHSASSSLRPDTLRVLFTAFPFEEVKTKLENLGAEVVSDVWSCSVVVTQHVKRTFKLLCAVGLGRPVVGRAWLQACLQDNALVDPWQHLLQDPAAEQRFRFSLRRALRGRRAFLRGYNVSCTPSVKPAADEMKLIVECSGGTWRAGGPNWLCVTCGADRALWGGLAAGGAALVSSELVLGGALRQELDVAGSRLA